MGEYFPQYLPIVIKHAASIEARLEIFARTTEETARWYKPRVKLTLPCVHCAGAGCYAEAPDGTRRSFDHRNFKAKDKYIATCPRCRGLGRRESTLKELRRAYRKLRKNVCRIRGFEPDDFDKMVKKRVLDRSLPTVWYEAAVLVAAVYGIDRV